MKRNICSVCKGPLFFFCPFLAFHSLGFGRESPSFNDVHLGNDADMNRQRSAFYSGYFSLLSSLPPPLTHEFGLRHCKDMSRFQTCLRSLLSRPKKRRPQRPTKGKEIVVPKFAEENDCKKLMHSREEEEEASSSPSLLLEFFPAD